MLNSSTEKEFTFTKFGKEISGKFDSVQWKFSKDNPEDIRVIDVIDIRKNQEMSDMVTYAGAFQSSEDEHTGAIVPPQVLLGLKFF